MTDEPTTVPPEELFAHAGWIRALARGLVHDPGAADDAVQETWIAATDRLRAGGTASRAWLAEVLRNFVRQRSRSEAGRAARERAVARRDGLPSPDELLERVEEQRTLVEAVSALEEPYRSTVILRYYEGLSSAEIARRRGEPPGRVRMRLSRALERLRTSMDRRHGGDRAAWMQALLPLAGAPPPTVAATGGPAAALLTGVLGMKILTVAAAGLLVLAGVFWATRAADVGAPRSNEGAAAAPAVALAAGGEPAGPGKASAPARTAEAEARVGPADARTELGGERVALAGRVVLPAGAPAEPALEVWALRAETPYDDLCLLAAGEAGLDAAVVARAPVDAAGAFELALPAELAVAHLAVHGRRAYLPRTVGVALPPAAPVELHARCGARVAGVVRGPDGAPVVDARVELRPDQLDASSQEHRGDEALRLELATDGAGRFELPALPPGLGHRLLVLPGRLAARLEPLEGLEPCDERSLDLRLPSGARVAGRVVSADGEPIAGATVRALLEASLLGFDAPVAREVTTAADGRFVLPGVPPGAVALQARRVGWLDGERVSLQLADGERVPDLRLVLDEGQAIAGRVAWSDGRPAAGVVVRAGFDPSHGFGPTAFNALRGAEGEGVSGDDGAFRVRGLGGGPFVVEAEAAGAGEAVHRARVDGVRPGTDELALVLRPPLALAGRAVDGAGRPLADVTVTGSRLVQGALGETASTSRAERFRDEDGRFELVDLEAGTWRLDARGPDHVLATPWVGELPRAAGAPPLELVLERSAGASGVVVDPDGEPVAGASVELDTGRSVAEQRMSRLPRPPEDVTDAEGRFALRGLPPGEVRVRAWAAGFAASEPAVLAVEPGERAEGLVLALTRGGTVTGEVYDDAGRPAEGRMVNLIRWQLGAVDSHMARTAADGTFRVEGVQPASWTVLAIDSGADLSTARPGGNAAAMLDSMDVANVEVREGETTHVVFGEPPADPVRVHGTVRQGGEPYGDAILGFLREDGGTLSDMAQAGVDADGRYEVVVDGPGAYLVSLTPLSGRPGEQNVLPFAREVPAGDEAELDFDVPLGALAGRVVGPDGEPVRARVTLSVDGPTAFPGGRYVETQTDLDGRYAIDALADGRYRLLVGGSSFLGEAGARARVSRGGLVIQHGARLDGVDFRLPLAGALEVRVTGPGGAPVPGAVVFVLDAEGAPLEPLSACTTDAAGRAVYDGLAPGVCTVFARTPALAGTAGEAVRVRADAATPVALQLEPATALLVQVTRDGEPVAAALRVEDEDGRELGGLLGVEELQRLLVAGGLSRREARVGPLPPGRYRVSAEADGLHAAKPVELRGEPERVLKLRLR